jgi:hypothetical protein
MSFQWLSSHLPSFSSVSACFLSIFISYPEPHYFSNVRRMFSIKNHRKIKLISDISIRNPKFPLVDACFQSRNSEKMNKIDFPKMNSTSTTGPHFVSSSVDACFLSISIKIQLKICKTHFHEIDKIVVDCYHETNIFVPLLVRNKCKFIFISLSSEGLIQLLSYYHEMDKPDPDHQNPGTLNNNVCLLDIKNP